MKKSILLSALLSTVLCVSAQQQARLWQNGEATKVTFADTPTLTYGSNGTKLTIGSTTYNTADIDSICIIHQIPIVFSENSATYSIPAAVSSDVTITTDGANVTVTNTNVSNEMEFVLSGSSSNGSFTYNGSYKVTFRLNGLQLTSTTGAALNILCGKRCAVVLEDGTTNTFSDYASGTQDACIYCKGHVEMEGGGTLNVTGNLTHAIKTKEYLQLKKSTGTINIVSAVGDAMNINQYYQQNGGTVNITSTTLGDGIQVDSTSTETDELNGQTIINGGKINIVMSQEDRKGIKSAGDITINGGTFVIAANGNGSRGIQTGTNMVIGEDKNTTTITVAATGGLCTKEEDADDPHRCMGIKVDGNLTVNAGTITVTNTGSKSRGIKVGGTYTKNGGTVTASIKN